MDFLRFKKTRSLNLNNIEVQKVYKKGFSQFPKIIISSNLNNEEGQKNLEVQTKKIGDFDAHTPTKKGPRTKC